MAQQNTGALCALNSPAPSAVALPGTAYGTNAPYNPEDNPTGYGAPTNLTPATGEAGMPCAIVQDYQNILGRAPDASGLQFWQNAAASGESLGCIQNAFYNSPEYQAKVAAAAPQPQPNPTPMAATGGLCYAAPAATTTTQGPTPAQQEQTYLANVPGANVCSWNQMVQASAQPGYHPTPFGPEAQSSAIIRPPMAATGGYGAPACSAIPIMPTCHPVNPVVACEVNQITQDYQQFLGRAPDPEGFAFWQSAARNGVPLSQIMAEISASPEAQKYMKSKS